MTKASIERRLRALETGQPKPSLGTLADPMTGDSVQLADLFSLLAPEELAALKALYLSEKEEIGKPGPELGPRSIEFLAVAFERLRARKGVR